MLQSTFTTTAGSALLDSITSHPCLLPNSPSVGARQPRLLAHSLDAELLGAIAPHQLPEAPHGKAAGTCDKLQQADTLLVVKLPNALRRRELVH